MLLYGRASVEFGLLCLFFLGNARSDLVTTSLANAINRSRSGLVRGLANIDFAWPAPSVIAAVFGMRMLKRAPGRDSSIECSTSVPSFLRGFHWFISTPKSLRGDFLRVDRESISSWVFTIPSRLKNSGCTGMMTKFEAVKALCVSNPIEGGQSIMMKSQVERVDLMACSRRSANADSRSGLLMR